MLSLKARSSFYVIALKTKDSDTIMDMMESIKSDMAHDEGLLKLTENLRRQKLWVLQKSARYRESLFEDRNALEAHFDALAEILGPEGPKQISLSVCKAHPNEFWKTSYDGVSGCRFCGDNSRVGHQTLFVSSNDWRAGS